MTRCSWCEIKIRWWRAAFPYCKRCALALGDKYGYSPPFPRGSRRESDETA